MSTLASTSWWGSTHGFAMRLMDRLKALDDRLPGSPDQERLDRKGGPGKIDRLLIERPAVVAGVWVAVMGLLAIPAVAEGSWLRVVATGLIVIVGVPLWFAASRARRRMWEGWVSNRQQSDPHPEDENDSTDG
jgi:hypothetical protein